MYHAYLFTERSLMNMISFHPLKLLLLIKQMSSSCKTGNMFRYVFYCISLSNDYISWIRPFLIALQHVFCRFTLYNYGGNIGLFCRSDYCILPMEFYRLASLLLSWSHVVLFYHLQHVFEHLHQQPKDSHDVDFSRVRMWCLNGWWVRGRGRGSRVCDDPFL